MKWEKIGFFFNFFLPPPPPPTLGIKNQNNKGMEDKFDIDSHCPYLLSGETTFHLTPY